MRGAAVLAALAALLVARPVAAAEPDLLLETLTGERALEMDLYLGHLARTPGHRPLLAGAALGGRIGVRLGTVARDATDEEAEALYRAVADAAAAFTRGGFGRVIATLERTVPALTGRDALLARDRRARQALEDGRLVLAHAYLRTERRAAAAAVMAEVLRAAPGREPSPQRYSPSLVDFHRQVRRDLDGQARATLKIVTRPEGATVLLGGEHAGSGPVRVPGLYPGRYRVFAQHGDRPGRVHEVAVASGDQEVVLDLELEAAVAGEERPALTYADPEARGRLEVGHAAALGRLLGAREVILIGVGARDGRAALQGAVVAVDSARPVRAGFVSLEPGPPDRATLESFGRFLRLGAAGPGVVVQVGGAAPQRNAIAWLRWVAVGVGLAGGAAGGLFIALDGRSRCDVSGVTCQSRYATMLPGVLTLTGGAALALLGGAAVLWHAGEGPRVALVPRGGGALLCLDGSFR
ncbi:MAG TPA: PEGA domain-containing protein [Polyangia bacterium]